MLAVSQWTSLESLNIIISISEIPMGGIAGWYDMHVFNAFITYYLVTLNSCNQFYIPPRGT